MAIGVLLRATSVGVKVPVPGQEKAHGIEALHADATLGEVIRDMSREGGDDVWSRAGRDISGRANSSEHVGDRLHRSDV